MKIYTLGAELDHYFSLTYVKKADIRKVTTSFNGKSMIGDWTSIETKVFVEEDGFTRQLCDFPSFGAIPPVFSAQAIESLKDLLLPNGEILPLTFEGKKNMYFAFNTTTIIDALNEEHSKLKRFSDSGVMWIDKYEFFPEKLVGAKIFKIPQLVQSLVYVTDEFVKSVNEAKLTGFRFVLIWND